MYLKCVIQVVVFLGSMLLTVMGPHWLLLLRVMVREFGAVFGVQVEITNLLYFVACSCPGGTYIDPAVCNGATQTDPGVCPGAY